MWYSVHEITTNQLVVQIKVIYNSLALCKVGNKQLVDALTEHGLNVISSVCVLGG